MVASRHRLRAVFAFAVALLVVPTLASAATADFRVLFDSDNNTATGCTEGPSHGVEQILVTRINTTDTSAQVTRMYRQVCTNGVFGAPVDLDLTARPAGFNSPSGLLLAESRVGFNALAPNAAMLPTLHLTFDASDGISTQRVLTKPNGNAILYPLPGDRRHSANSSAQGRNMVLDGQAGDWNGIEPLVVGVATEGTTAVRILKIYAFANVSDRFLYFRFDGFLDNSNPFAQDDTFARKSGQSVTIPAPAVLANDGDPSGKPLTATPVSPADNGDVTLNPDGSFTYVPNDPTSDKSDKFDYKANNGQKDSNVARVTIKVSNKASGKPTADEKNVTTPEDTPITITLTGSDPDGDPLTFSIQQGPVHGSLGPITPTGPTSATVLYTPDPNFSSPPTDQFHYRVNDGSNPSDQAKVTITVSQRQRRAAREPALADHE